MTASAALRVGLTGGLASGKSTVARRLAAAGLTVADADRWIAESHEPGGAGAAAVAALLGADGLRPDGGSDRARVAARVFADADLRARLEAALHPLVRERFRRLAAETEGVVVLEATKLVEAGMAGAFDVLVTVEAPVEERVARAVARGLDEAAARARVAAQGDDALRRGAADVVIRNDGDLATLERRADALARELLERAASR